MSKEPTNLPAMHTGGKVAAIVPATWQEITQIAGAICRAGMAPKSYLDKEGNPLPDKVAVAIMHGLEVGFTPMASLQSIAVINGMPSLYGDGMLAVVRASGLLEDIEETDEWDDKGPVKAICRVKRKGEATWGIMTCARADAQQAGWWDKAGPWKATPHRMLQMRARGWALRDKFADVLRGLKSAEELNDMVDVTPAATQAATPEPQRADAKYRSESRKDEAPKGEPQEQKAGPLPTKAEKNEAPPETKRANVTDVKDLNEEPENPPSEEQPSTDDPTPSGPHPIVFEEYKRIGDFFAFSDTWLIDPKRTEAEIVAFGAFYHQYMKERLDPNWKSQAVHKAMLDTRRLYDEALTAASKRSAAKA